MYKKSAYEHSKVGFLYAVPLALAFFFFISAWFGYISDSEIWAVTLSKELTNTSTQNISLFAKVFFYIPLRILYLLPGDNCQLFLHARLLFAVIGLINVLLLWKLALVLERNNFLALLSAILLMSSTYFQDQGYRIRADLLACIFNLCFLIVFFQSSKKNESNGLSRSALIQLFFAELLMLLTTPKAILFAMAHMVLLFFWALRGRGRQKKIQQIISFFLPIVLGALLLLVLGNWGSVRYQEAQKLALQYFLHSFNDSSGPYFSLSSFRYVFQFGRDNLIFSLALIAYLASVVMRIAKDKSPPISLWEIFTLAIFASCLMHNQLTPFFITSVLPILAIGAAHSLIQFITFLVKKSHIQLKIPLFFAFGAISIIRSGLYLQGNMYNKNNLDQLHAINYLEDYMANFPGVLYYDVIGLMPKQNNIYGFLGPAQKEQNELAFSKVEALQPELLLEVDKTKYALKDFYMLAYSKYIDLGYGVFGKAYLLHPISDKGKTGKLGKSEGYFIRLEGKGAGFWMNSPSMQPAKPVVALQTREWKGGVYYRLPIAQARKEINEIFKNNNPDSPLYSFIRRYPLRTDMKDRPLLIVRSNGKIAPINTNENWRKYFADGKEILLPDWVSEFAISIYPPVDMPNRRDLMNLFAYDAFR